MSEVESNGGKACGA